MGGYTPIVGGRGLTETSGTVGRRFGAEKRLGVLFGGTYDWNGRGIDDVEPVADVATQPDGSTQRHFESIDIREYQYYRSRWGLTGSSDYQLGNNSNIHVRGLYSDFKNYGSRWVYSLTDNTPGNPIARFQRLRHRRFGGHGGTVRGHSVLQQFDPAPGHHDR